MRDKPWMWDMKNSWLGYPNQVGNSFMHFVFSRIMKFRWFCVMSMAFCWTGTFILSEMIRVLPIFPGPLHYHLNSLFVVLFYVSLWHIPTCAGLLYKYYKEDTDR